MKRSVSGRTVAATVRNDTSSRSHSIFQVQLQPPVEFIALTAFQLKITARHAGRPATECTAAVPPQTLSGVLNMIDLAGSESLTSSDPVRIAETQHINKSLGSIADVIGAISSKQVRLGDGGCFGISCVIWLIFDIRITSRFAIPSSRTSCNQVSEAKVCQRM